MKYLIKSGDTLSKIAKANEISLAELLEANPEYKADPDWIRVGDALVIPDGGEEKPIIDPDPDDSPLLGASASAEQVLGTLSAKYETGGRGPGTVSTGRGDAGGVSYGSYQMTSTGGGTVGRFVSQTDFPWRYDFAGLTPGGAPFTAAWKKIAAATPDRFQAVQHAYIKQTHFDPLVAKVKAEDGLDLTTRSQAMQDAVWSTAVQHGPGSRIIHKAIVALQGLDSGASDFDERLIKAIYAERGRKEADGDLVYFSRNAPDVQKGVAARFVNEQQDALTMLADEGQQSGGGLSRRPATSTPSTGDASMSNLVVTASALNLRDAPTTEGQVMAILDRGAVVESVEASADGHWQKVRHGADTGWASFKYLQPAIAAAPVAAFPWFDIAMKELGISETAGAGDNPRIVEYLRSTSLGAAMASNDETPWCAAFVNFCVEQAGFAGTDSASARSWLNWGRKTDVPVTGCIAVFKRGDPPSGHVAFYVSESGGHIKVLGGNQGDKVCFAQYSKDRLLGYRVPR